MPPPSDRLEGGNLAPWATAAPGSDGLASPAKALAAASVPVALQTVPGTGDEDDDDDEDGVGGGGGGGGGNIEPDDDEGYDDEDDDDDEPLQVKAPGLS
jgi:hypothetical protein